MYVPESDNPGNDPAAPTGRPILARVQAAPSWWAATTWLHPSCLLTDLDNGGSRINRVAHIRLAERLVWTCGCVGSTVDNGHIARLQEERLLRTRHGPDTVKQQVRKIILQGPSCRETRFPRNGRLK